MSTTRFLSRAYRLHYDKRFEEACVAYHDVLASSPSESDAAIARQQLGNLRDFDAAVTPAGSQSDVGVIRPPAYSRDDHGSHEDVVGQQLQNRGDLQGGEGRR